MLSLIKKDTKVIFIDWFGTLCNMLLFHHISNPRHPFYASAKEIRNTIYVRKASLLDDAMKGKISLKTFCNTISLPLGIPSWAFSQEYAVSMSSLKWADPDLPGMLVNIREQGMKVVLVADSLEGFRRYTVPSLKLDQCFDDFLISSIVGSLKFEATYEDMLFFKDYLKKNNIDYKNCLLIDDSPNERVLQQFGMPYVKTETSSDVLNTLSDILTDLSQR